MTKPEFIQNLIDKQLGFGWWNGEFVTNPTVFEEIEVRDI